MQILFNLTWVTTVFRFALTHLKIDMEEITSHSAQEKYTCGVVTNTLIDVEQ